MDPVLRWSRRLQRLWLHCEHHHRVDSAHNVVSPPKALPLLTCANTSIQTVHVPKVWLGVLQFPASARLLFASSTAGCFIGRRGGRICTFAAGLAGRARLLLGPGSCQTLRAPACTWERLCYANTCSWVAPATFLRFSVIQQQFASSASNPEVTPVFPAFRARSACKRS